jgi:hypothetical protein
VSLRSERIADFSHRFRFARSLRHLAGDARECDTERRIFQAGFVTFNFALNFGEWAGQFWNARNSRYDAIRYALSTCGLARWDEHTAFEVDS